MTNNRVRNLSKISCLMAAFLTLSFLSIPMYSNAVNWTCNCNDGYTDEHKQKSGTWDGLGTAKLGADQTCIGRGKADPNVQAISCVDENGKSYNF